MDSFVIDNPRSESNRRRDMYGSYDGCCGFNTDAGFGSQPDGDIGSSQKFRVDLGVHFFPQSGSIKPCIQALSGYPLLRSTRLRART